MSKGAYIAIEGIPGAGKTTLIQMLAHELQAANTPVLTLAAADTPTDLTAQTISRIIEDPRYPLTTQAEVLLYNAVRAQSLEKIRASIDAGVTCIIDQSYLSVLVQEYYGRGTIADYTAADEIIRFATGSLQPDLVIVLDTPVNTAKSRPRKGASPEFTEAQLERVRAGYLWEAKQRNIPVVYASDPIEAVFEHVKSHASNVISALKPQPNATGSKQETSSVAEVLAAHPVSSKTSEIPPAPEPPLAANTPQNAQPTSQTSEPNYQHNIGRGSILLETHLNQLQLPYTTSLRRLDQKGRSRRPYYVPEVLQGKLRTNYIRTLDQILETRTQLLAELTTYIRSTSTLPKNQQTNRWQANTKAQARDTLEVLLPLATTSVINTQVLPQNMQTIAIDLQSNSLPEAQRTGRYFLQNVLASSAASDKQSLTEVITTSASQRQEADKATAQLITDLLPNNYATPSKGVTLTYYTPKNELDGIAQMCYMQSDLPLRELSQAIATLSYEQKLAAFKRYVGAPAMPGRALEAITYQFDIVSDYQSFHALVKQGGAEQISWQVITPRIGYETPKLIEEAGLSEAFAQCFDLSLLLHSELQAAGHYIEAQYASLLGHRLRWQVTYNARTLSRLYSQSERSINSQSVLSTMHEVIAEVHPLLAEAMQTTNQAATHSTASAKA